MDKNHAGITTDVKTPGAVTMSSHAAAEPEYPIQELLGGKKGMEEKGRLSIILCSDPIRKTRFLGMLAGTAPEPVCYLDTDLLYAGCVGAGLCNVGEHTTVLCPDQTTWCDELAGAISKASLKRMAVIIDSLNGVYEMFGGPDAAMSANVHLMMLASLAAQSGSSVVIGAVVRKRRQKAAGSTYEGSKSMPGTHSSDNPATHTKGMHSNTGADPATEWIVHPGGRQIPKIARSRTYLLKGTIGNPLLTYANP